MTKKLDPEIKALYAIRRALKPLDPEAQQRAIDYFHAKLHDTTQDQVRIAMRLHRFSA